MLNSAKTASGAAVSPASYQLVSVKLTMNNSAVIDITQLVADITVSESMFLSSITTVLHIVDGFDLLRKAHLTGGEKLQIKIMRKNNSDESYSTAENKFDITCYLSRIVNHVKPKAGIQTYMLSCLSEHTFISQMKSISRSFNSNSNALVRDICLNDLKYTGETNFSDKNLPVISGIYPNLKPLDTIHWLLRNIDDEDTPFFFYETAAEGLQLNSYNQLSEQEVFKKYNNSPFYINKFETKEHFKEAQCKIIDMSSDFDMRKFDQIGDGAFSAIVHNVDIANKKYTINNFDHSLKNNIKLNDYAGVSKNIKFDDTALNESYGSKEFFVSSNSKSFEGEKITYHEKIKDSISAKNSYFQNIRFMGLEIELYGDFNLCPGKIIELKIVKSTDANILESNQKEGMIDKHLSGKYLVAAVEHVFDGNEYRCLVSIHKDSLNYDLDSNIKIGI